MMIRRAQTATEYLIILAVVIIIALIVVSAMGGIPGMGGASKQKASQAYWNTAKIAITSYAIGPTSTTLYLRNNNLEAVTIDAISLSGVNLNITPITLSTGETRTFSSTNVHCVTGSNSFSHGVRINYTDTSTNGVYTFTGDGQPLDGSCATG